MGVMGNYWVRRHLLCGVYIANLWELLNHTPVTLGSLRMLSEDTQ